MGTLMLEQIKKQTTNFLQEKYKIARMKFTDVTEAELLAEQATNKDPCSPDAKTMTRIAEASFELDDYWRIVDLLHQRLCTFNCEDWRRSYKALVLLEFLLTHGPEDFAVEFQCDSEVIEELGSFTHVDERGFNWGARMQKISDQILQLLQGGTTLREARLKALKITNEIHGFGSLDSPSSSSTPSSSNSDNPHASSSFCSSFSSTSSTPTFIDSITEFTKNPFSPSKDITNISYSPIGVDEEEEKPKEKPKGFVNGICSKIIGSANNALRGGRGEKIEFRSLSDVGRKANKKRFERQNSLWY
ncbi:ENTH domain-containing protein [Senna tora]|uniref:ENTH domain-containing protein n=1 Tax=Senna tora TaxID=362788 RepID=A0A834W2P1_9FABA|nr:ENTH domain-containing protein [Senna tora]